MLSESQAHERTLAKDLASEQLLLRTAATSHNKLVESTKLWTSHLMDVAEQITTQLTAMGMPNFKFSHEARVAESARLSEFLECVLAALKLLQSTRADYQAEALDGFHGLDRAVRMYAGDLRVAFADSLTNLALDMDM